LKEQTQPDFLFSLKFPQIITHHKMLKNCQEETRVFLERTSQLNEKLGVLLLQFPPIFRQQHIPLLAEYLKTLPNNRRYAVEARNKSLLNEDVYSLLRESNVALAWVDDAKMPLITEATADFVYLRWEGDRKTVMGTLGKIEADRTDSIREWSAKLETIVNGATDVFGYFSKYYSGLPPSDVVELVNAIQ
jgi:uncharacterized protein YecE (DUF72 family)